MPLPIGWGPTVAEKVWGELKEGGEGGGDAG